MRHERGAVLTGYIAVAVGVLLLMSFVANYVLYSTANEQRDRAAQAEASRDAFKLAGASCSASVQSYRDAADRAVRNAQAALVQAGIEAGKHEAVADRVLAAKPSSSDDCRAALDLLDGWMQKWK